MKLVVLMEDGELLEERVYNEEFNRHPTDSESRDDSPRTSDGRM
jgi:hypothetical protein